jgi:hypothetical protein
MVKRILFFAFLCLSVIIGLGIARKVAAKDEWRIKGTLSEACTCAVPCTCNFGEGPSPHHYCYAVYAYEIKEGNFNGIQLDGLRFGAIDAEKGNSVYLDERATREQRPALEAVARKVLRISGDKMGHSTLLGIRYVEVKQQYDGKQAMVDLGGYGSFKTHYIMGLDKSQPVVVVNNTTWMIHEAIKGKTEYLRIEDKYGDTLSSKDTNSNQGDFDYNHETQFRSQAAPHSCSSDQKNHGELK